MGKYMDWRDTQLIARDEQLPQDRFDDWDDHNPFEDDWHDATLAGYEATIKRGDGLVEWGYQSILLFLGLPADELREWRASLVAALSTKLRTKFDASQNAYLEQLARQEQIKANKADRKRHTKGSQTIDPIAGNAGETKSAAKAKPAKKPTSDAKGAVRKYANEQAKQSTNKLI